jgi:3-isopropylmalate/(R)-2-methylmalate dehydratase large subunit
MGRTLAEKVWDAHVVRRAEGEPDLLYIDLHLVHEVTSPQAFDGLRAAGRPVHRPDLTLATEDHNVPTTDVEAPIADPVSRLQVETLRANCAEFGIRLYPMGDVEQGIVHVVGPQLGLTQPGMTVVCGDSAHLDPRRVRRAGLRHRHQSRSSTCWPPRRFRCGRSRPWRSPSTGGCAQGVSGQGHHPRGDREDRHRRRSGLRHRVPRAAIRALSMEQRMTVCNMSIEAGARAGMVAPDETTFAYLRGRRHRPAGRRLRMPPSGTGASWSRTTTPASTPRSCSTPRS